MRRALEKTLAAAACAAPDPAYPAGAKLVVLSAPWGGDKSNRLLMEALARAATSAALSRRISEFGPEPERGFLAELDRRGRAAGRRDARSGCRFELRGVEVAVVTDAALRASFAAEVETFRPDVILTSTDDPAQMLLETALGGGGRGAWCTWCGLRWRSLRARLRLSRVRPRRRRSGARTASWESVSYVTGYVRRYGGMEASHVPSR